jgi:hypothetical protein
VTDEAMSYKARLIDEIDFALMIANKGNKDIVPGLEEALKIIEETK